MLHYDEFVELKDRPLRLMYECVKDYLSFDTFCVTVYQDYVMTYFDHAKRLHQVKEIVSYDILYAE